MPHLHELTAEMLELDALLEDCVQEDGTIAVPDDVLARHILIDRAVEDRVEHLVHYIQELEIVAETQKAEYQAVKKFVEAYRKAAQAAEGKVTAIKQYIKFSLETGGRDRFDTPHFTLAVQNNGGQAPLRIAPDAKIDKWPDEFVRVEFSPNAEAIREAAENGKELPAGAEVLPRGTHLRIRGRSKP